ncbi:sigma-70 family RNA polymerase sigma factor [uncultured Intestinimonas sp.]|uniref:RNA polymerase sigma factor n=1 Tax=uncultured Intestinimonas sp. TaxID=1689265 RepID=UPI0025E7EC19|nr:sigma-70 family RNA polymerase sigma factor [uncultured Intestinimonas sp.]
MEQEELTTLIQRARQGDPDAQDTLVRKVQDRVYYHCKKMLNTEDAAQDATQDVLIAMLTNLDKLKEPAAFWGWVNGITANRCRHLLSAPHKEWQIPEDDAGNSMLDDLENLDETLMPEAALDDAETRRMILDLVDALPPEQRLSVLFYYYDEMSVKDIAQTMDVSEGTVKSRLNYARKSIRQGVEAYERKGVKLYSVSPFLLLVFYLRQEASACVLEDTAAAAMAAQAVAQAGAAAVEGTGGAAVGTSAAAGVSAAGTATAGLSTKLVAGLVAAVILVGGGAVGISVLMGGDSPEESAPPLQEEVQAAEDTSFGALHGFTIVEPQPYEDLPLTAVCGDDGLVVLSSSGSLTQPEITVSQPDGEGYVTYTIRCTNTAQVVLGGAEDTSLALTLFSQEYSFYDWYTGRLYFPDRREDDGGEALAVGEAQVEHDGETFSLSYEKRWTSGVDYGDWRESSQPGLEREITIDAFQEEIYTMRAPEDYDGVLLGVNIVDPPDPERVIQAEWDLETDAPDHFIFLRLSDHQ